MLQNATPLRKSPAALASLLFDPPEPQIIGKTQCFRDFPTFLRTCIFFLLTLSLLWSSLFYSSLLSDSSHLCFSSVHIVGSLTSKLPLMNLWTIADYQFTDACWFCTNSWASVGENPPLMGFLPSTTSKMAWQQPWWMLTGFPSRSTKGVLSKGITLSSCPSSPS